MRVAVLTADGFEVREEERPRCGPGQVLVGTASCGVCEGEVFHYRHVISGEESGNQADAPSEMRMGHEGSGRVLEVGEGVRGLEPGDAVTALGGAFGECFLAGAADVVKLPPQVDPLWAMGEPVACCVHAAGRFGIRPGDRVAVIGVGFMGLVCLQLARLQGAAHLCAADLLPWRLETALRLGADAIYDASGRSGEQACLELGEFDVVIEAAGTPSALDLAGWLVRYHGRIVVVGYHLTEGGMRTVNMQQWNFKAIDMIHGHVRRHGEKVEAMRAGVRLMAGGRLAVEPLVAHYPLDEVGAAFDDVIARKEGLFKAALACGA